MRVIEITAGIFLVVSLAATYFWIGTVWGRYKLWEEVEKHFQDKWYSVERKYSFWRGVDLKWKKSQEVAKNE